jgi:hypothetical protein
MTSALCAGAVASAAAVQLFQSYRVSARLALDLSCLVCCVTLTRTHHLTLRVISSTGRIVL